MPKVLISDKLSPRAVEIFGERGVEADVKTGLDPDALRKIIGDYDGFGLHKKLSQVLYALLSNHEWTLINTNEERLFND